MRKQNDSLKQAQRSISTQSASVSSKPYSYSSKNHISGTPSFGKEFKVERLEVDYTVGDKVRHIKFGNGIVTGLVSGGRDYEVTVNFEKAGVKKMFASFAKLKKID